MKNLSVLILFISVSLSPFAQNFPGYRSGNYTGVNGVFFNPASIADNRYNWDINVLGIHAGLTSNRGSFGLNNIHDVFNNVDQLMYGNTDKSVRGSAGMDFFGPSGMYQLNKKTSIAFSTRFRSMTTFSGLEGNFIQSINNSLTKPVPLSINRDNRQRITINGWADFGASLARVLLNNGKHFIKGGITLKYLAGSGNSYVSIDQMKGSLNKDSKGDVYMSDASGVVNIGHAGIDLDDFRSKNALKFNGSGVGADIGFVYEYRPQSDHLKEPWENKYKIKIGISLLDIGSLKYKPGANMINNYSLHVSAAQQWYPREISGLTVSKIIDYTNNSPYFTNNSTGSNSYNVNLPTSLQLNADYAVTPHWYVEAAGQINLANKTNLYNTAYENTFSITPRYEKKEYGIYLPLSYNEVSKFNVGIAVRFGPVYVGSGSLFTVLFGKSKQADVHVGIHFGNLFKKPKPKKIIETPPPVVEKPAAPADGDADGVIDTEDKCPTVSGLAKYNGCPIPDTDHDSVNDEEDKCPTIAGIVANSGCPEIKAEIVKKMVYAARQIYFITGKATILSKSFPALNYVVKILKSNPNLNLQIDGYTDNTGTATINLALSEKRALAVKAYLIRKGVAKDRITHKGYGQENPVADNKTMTGRAKNRRVELTLEY